MPNTRSVQKKSVRRGASSRKVEAAPQPAPSGFAKHEGDPNFVLSLARGLKVIEAFENHTEGLSVSDVARQTGLSRAAVRRLLITLEMLGYAETDGRVYALKPTMLKLGFSYLSSAGLPSIAQPIVEQFSEQVHESSSVCIMDGDEIVYVARASAKRVMSVGLSVGSRLPAYCTSMGRVLLAALPEADFAAYLQRIELKAMTPKTVIDKRLLASIVQQVRSNGFCIADEELELGLRSIAVPVKSRQNRVVAAMNIGVHATRASTGEMMQRLLPRLRESADQLGSILR